MLTETAHLAANLRRLRRERDLTQMQVATLTGLTQPYVSQLERGLRPTRLDHVAHLARALAVAPAELLAPRVESPAPDRPGAKRVGAPR